MSATSLTDFKIILEICTLARMQAELVHEANMTENSQMITIQSQMAVAFIPFKDLLVYYYFSEKIRYALHVNHLSSR